MVSKSSAPHSIRFRNDLWERVCVRARRDKITPNEAVIALVEAGLAPTLRNTSRAKSEPWIDEKTGRQHTLGGVGLHLDVPLHKPKPFNPQPKKGRK